MKRLSAEAYFLFTSFLLAALSIKLALPYYFIPSDDRSFLLDPNRVSLRPVLLFALDLVRRGVLLYEPWPAPSTWVWLNGFSLGLILFCLQKLVLYGTQNLLVSLLTAFLFAASHWAQTYFYWGSYTLFTTALFMASLTFWVSAWYSKSKWGFFMSSLCLAAAFWSGPSGVLLVATLFVGVFYLNLRNPVGNSKLWFFIALTTSAIAIPGVWCGPALLSHWSDNYRAVNAHLAERFYQVSDAIPWGSFFLVLATHSKGMLILFLAAMVICFWKFRYSALPAAFFCMGGFFAIAMDLLPFTKLGRTLFPGQALFLVAAAIVTGLSVKEITKTSRTKQLLAMSSAILFFIALGAENLSSVLVTRERKQALGNYFATLPAETPVFVFPNEMHAWHFQEILGRKLQLLPPSSHSLPHNSLVLVGPHGPGSGRTALLNAIAKEGNISDSELATRGLKIAENILFYSYHPPFAMEAEVPQALFFHGLLPDEQKKELSVSIYRAPAKPSP